MPLDNQKVVTLQPHSVKFVIGETDALDLVENKLIPEYVRHTKVWFLQGMTRAFPRDLQASLNCAHISQASLFPSHGIPDGVPEHLDEERRDEVTERFVHPCALAFDARRSVQDAGDAALFVERGEGDQKRIEVFLPNRYESAASSLGDKFRLAMLDHPVHEVAEGNGFIWSNGSQASTNTASFSRDVGGTDGSAN